MSTMAGTYGPKLSTSHLLQRLKIGTGEILSTPLNGVYISRMMKIAEETASALKDRVAITVELVGAKRPKLAEDGGQPQDQDHQQWNWYGLLLRFQEHEPFSLP